MANTATITFICTSVALGIGLWCAWLYCCRLEALIETLRHQNESHARQGKRLCDENVQLRVRLASWEARYAVKQEKSEEATATTT